MVITVIVHPIDTMAHPTVPAGWRWCVQTDADPLVNESWLNAGWCSSKSEAAMTGEMVASAVVKALAAAFVDVSHTGTIYLSDDPIPEGF